MAPRLVVLGWDSASWDVADPLVAEGHLPVLGDLLRRGFRAPLRSVWPPMTDCAWTSAFTGTNPGRHGIFGSWYRAPGAYACRYFSSRDRKVPGLWEHGAGVRWLVWNVPMTFPPTPVTGAMVAGYGAPPGAVFTWPADLGASLGGRFRLDDLLDRAPHGSLDRFLNELLRGLEVQAEALPWAAEKVGADCVAAVWPHIDRAQHFFWRFRGTDHRLADAVERVYRAMDRATGRLLDAWPEADVVVVSDHGAGPLYSDVNLGSWLADGGYASYGRAQERALLDLAWALPPPVRRMGKRLVPGLARRAVGATLTGQLGSFHWADTRAFVGVHGDLWLNLAGREPLGCVEPGEAPELLADLRGRIGALEDPGTGRRLFAAVYARDEIYSGAQSANAPDLMLDGWSTGYRVAPGREASEDTLIAPAPLSGVKEAWSADHRPLGIIAGAGPRIASGDAPELALLDVCPTALALLEQPVPEGLDGRVATELLQPDWLQDHPVRAGAPVTARDEAGGYSAAEADSVAAHLKDLGYIE
ncbi:MAG: alkaline phosphatase family protein [Actinomycetota bacterium]|nr:alkaline phosphatase family protein [Actinomycetota bacterium]